jgi:hypothetical protein
MFERIEGLVCWKCGHSLADLSLPLRRQETCRACDAELHVCRLCEFHDATVAKSCREPVAEEVKDKTRSNFCDYFRPRPHAFQATGDAAATARAQLDSLFGNDPAAQSSPEDAALAQLEELFGGPSSPRKGR